MEKSTLINLQNFYPSDQLSIVNILEDIDSLQIHLKSCKNSCRCPNCGIVSHRYHGTYIRNVQELPIHGMRIQFQISAYEYNCENTACSTTTIAESYDHFIQPYSRMTNRLSEFLFTLALETSCEGAARIAKTMNIKISGDTIIKLLIKKYDSTNVSSCSDVIGVDDFAFKKGSNYGTIIVDDE